MDKIKLLIVDDHQMVRLGLSSFMNIQPDIEVVGEAADGESGYLKAKNLKPDVILMDLVMDRLDGIGATQKVFPALVAGAKGNIFKTFQAAEIAIAIRKFARGKMFCRERLKKKSINKSIENLNCMTIFQKEKWKFWKY